MECLVQQRDNPRQRKSSKDSSFGKLQSEAWLAGKYPYKPGTRHSFDDLVTLPEHSDLDLSVK